MLPRLLTLTFVLALVGCTTQPVGGRCEQDQDCSELVNGARSVVCRQEASPGTSCGTSARCICCPLDPAGTISACVPRDTVTDGGATGDR